VLAETVAPAADENNVFAPFHILQPVDRVIKRIEKVRLLAHGHSRLQTADCAQDRPLVLGEILKDMRPEIIGNHGYPIVFFQRLGKNICRFDGIYLEAVEVLVIGKLHQHHSRDRGLDLREAGNGLGDVIFQHSEIFFLQAGDESAIFG
jgi:hypothetical protein